MHVIEFKFSMSSAAQVLLNLLADNRQLTVLQYDRVIRYLQDKREVQLQLELGDAKDLPPVKSTGMALVVHQVGSCICVAIATVSWALRSTHLPAGWVKEKVITHLHLTLKLRISGVICPLTHVCFHGGALN